MNNDMNNVVEMPTVEPDNLEAEKTTTDPIKCTLKKKVIPIEEIAEVCMTVIETIGKHTPETKAIGGK